MELHQLFLCLGGNQGKKVIIFEKTRSLIREQIGIIQKESPVYASPPWGFKSRSLFWNQVVEVTTPLTPFELLSQTGLIEAIFGRNRKGDGYQSRKMDLDILLYDSLVIETDTLIIPHPRMGLRRFVLQPLTDIAPDLVHPVTGLSISEMLQSTPDTSGLTLVSPSLPG